MIHQFRRLALHAFALASVSLAACGDDTTTATTAGSDTASGGSESTAGSSDTDASTSFATTDGTATGPTASGSTTGTSASTSTTSTTSASTTSTTSDASDTDSATGTGDPVECVYPVIWPADQDAKSSVETALAALSPGAALEWHDDRGTLKYIGNLEVVFDCPDDTPLWEAVFAFFESEPDVFQMSGDQWILEPLETKCVHVDETPTTFNTSRDELGDWAVFRDAVNVRLYRDAQDQVVMRSMGATYVPAMPPEIREQIYTCLDSGPAQEVLEQAVRDEPFPYLSYLGADQICQPAFMGNYHADPIDAINFTADAQVDWYEAGDGTVVVTVDQRVELVVDPQNVTDELAASNAACPDEMNPGIIVGFFAYLDLVTATIASKGAGLGCIVC